MMAEDISQRGGSEEREKMKYIDMKATVDKVERAKSEDVTQFQHAAPYNWEAMAGMAKTKIKIENYQDGFGMEFNYHSAEKNTIETTDGAENIENYQRKEGMKLTQMNVENRPEIMHTYMPEVNIGKSTAAPVQNWVGTTYGIEKTNINQEREDTYTPQMNVGNHHRIMGTYLPEMNVEKSRASVENWAGTTKKSEIKKPNNQEREGMELKEMNVGNHHGIMGTYMPEMNREKSAASVENWAGTAYGQEKTKIKEANNQVNRHGMMGTYMPEMYLDKNIVPEEYWAGATYGVENTEIKIENNKEKVDCEMTGMKFNIENQQERMGLGMTQLNAENHQNDPKENSMQTTDGLEMREIKVENDQEEIDSDMIKMNVENRQEKTGIEMSEIKIENQQKNMLKQSKKRGRPKKSDTPNSLEKKMKFIDGQESMGMSFNPNSVNLLMDGTNGSEDGSIINSYSESGALDSIIATAVNEHKIDDYNMSFGAMGSYRPDWKPPGPKTKKAKKAKAGKIDSQDFLQKVAAIITSTDVTNTDVTKTDDGKAANSDSGEKKDLEKEENDEGDRSTRTASPSDSSNDDKVVADIIEKDIEGGEVMYGCSVCHKFYKMRKSVEYHIKVKHKAKTLYCYACTKTFQLKCDLKRHLNVHAGVRPFGCQDCDRSFACRSSLLRHRKMHHLVGDIYKCNLCEKAFRIDADLKSHMYTHTGEKPWGCDQCDKAFTTKSSLTVHKRIHDDSKKLSCSLCPRLFHIRADLIRHEMLHSGDLKWECAICDRRYASRSGVKRHIRDIHVFGKLFGKEKSSNEILIADIIGSMSDTGKDMDEMGAFSEYSKEKSMESLLKAVDSFVIYRGGINNNDSKDESTQDESFSEENSREMSEMLPMSEGDEERANKMPKIDSKAESLNEDRSRKIPRTMPLSDPFSIVKSKNVDEAISMTKMLTEQRWQQISEAISINKLPNEAGSNQSLETDSNIEMSEKAGPRDVSETVPLADPFSIVRSKDVAEAISISKPPSEARAKELSETFSNMDVPDEEESTVPLADPFSIVRSKDIAEAISISKPTTEGRAKDVLETFFSKPIKKEGSNDFSEFSIPEPLSAQRSIAVSETVSMLTPQMKEESKEMLTKASRPGAFNNDRRAEEMSRIFPMTSSKEIFEKFSMSNSFGDS